MRFPASVRAMQTNKIRVSLRLDRCAENGGNSTARPEGCNRNTKLNNTRPKTNSNFCAPPATKRAAIHFVRAFASRCKEKLRKPELFFSLPTRRSSAVETLRGRFWRCRWERTRALRRREKVFCGRSRLAASANSHLSASRRFSSIGL